MDFEPEQYIPLCCATVELHRPYELPRPSVVNLSQCISKHMRRPVCQVLASEENFSSSEAPAAPVDGEEIDANVGACGGPQHVFSHRRVSSSDVCSACPLWLVEASYAARSREVEVLIGRRPDTPSQARLELWVDLGRLRFGEDLSCTLKQTLALLALHLHPLRIGEQPALRSSPCGVYDCKHHQPSDHDSLASLYDSVEKESLQKSLSTLSDEIFFSAFLRNPGLPSSSLDQLPQAVLLRLLNFLSRDDMQRLRCCSTFLYRELTRAVPGLTTKDMSKSIDRSSPEMLKVSNYKRLTQGFHKAELYAHQQHSLLQMQRVEKARVGPFAPLGADLTSFWTEFPVPLPRESETSRFLLICISSRLESFQLGGDWASMSAFSLYLCASTGVLQIGMSSELIPKPAFVWPSGGFLCDDPGLGKTLSILSLVAKDCSVDMTTPAFAAYRTVVLPPEVFTHPGPFTMDDLLNVNESLSACPAKGLVCLYPQPAARPAANALWNPVLDVSVYTDIQAALKPSGRPSAVARVMKSLAPSPTDRWMAESWSKFTAYQDQQQKDRASRSDRARKALDAVRCDGENHAKIRNALKPASDVDERRPIPMRALLTGPSPLYMASTATLVVCPKAVLSHWEAEIRRWFPKMKGVYLLRCLARSGLSSRWKFAKARIVLISFHSLKSVLRLRRDFVDRAEQEVPRASARVKKRKIEVPEWVTVLRRLRPDKAVEDTLWKRIAIRPSETDSEPDALDVPLCTPLHPLQAQREAEDDSIAWLRTSFLGGIFWRRIIVDEGHSLGISKSLSMGVLRHLKATSRWVVTGTPAARSVRQGAEQWARMFEFIRLPVSLGHQTSRYFDFIIRPQLMRGNAQAWRLLERLVSSCLVRHSKSMVALPRLNGPNVVSLELTAREKSAYNDLVQVIERNLFCTYFSRDNRDSLLHPNNRMLAKEAIWNIIFVGFGYSLLRVGVYESDLVESMEMLRHCKPLEPWRDVYNHKQYEWPEKRLQFVEETFRFIRQSRSVLCDRCNRRLRFPVLVPCPALHLLCVECMRDRSTLFASRKPVGACPECGADIHNDFFDRLQPPISHAVASDSALHPSLRVASESLLTKAPSGVLAGRLVTHNHVNYYLWGDQAISADALPVTAHSAASVVSPGAFDYQNRIGGLPAARIRASDCRIVPWRLVDGEADPDVQRVFAESSKVRYACSKILSVLRSGRGQNNIPPEFWSQPDPGIKKCPKILVISSITEELFLLGQVLTRVLGVPCAQCHPGVPAWTDQLLRFQFGDEVPVLLMYLPWGAHGVDLSCVCTILILDPVTNVNVELQVVARAHRMGAVGEVEVETLVNQNSIEETILHHRSLWSGCGSSPVNADVNLSRMKKTPRLQGMAAMRGQTHLRRADASAAPQPLESEDEGVPKELDTLQFEYLLRSLKLINE